MRRSLVVIENPAVIAAWVNAYKHGPRTN